MKLPPPLLVTMIGCGDSLYLPTMAWTTRAKLSVPPPGPEVTTNSMGLVGCQACAAVRLASVKAAETARVRPMHDMRFFPLLCRFIDDYGRRA